MTKTFTRVLAALMIAAVMLAPSLAEARAGGSIGGSGSSGYSSMGSLGSRTYQSSPYAAPINRSLTQNQPSYGQPGYGYPRNSFLSGLGAGLLGAWLGNMLFGHWGYGYGMGHGGGIFGTLLLLFFCYWVGRMIWRSFSGFGAMGGGTRAPFVGAGMPLMNAYQSVPRAAQPTLALSDGDLNDFTEILTAVQGAWSDADLNRLRRYVTPEMLSYFAELLGDNTSRGYVNRVLGVTLLKGDPKSSWSEGDADYATTALQWSALDYNERIDHPGAIVSGSPTQPVVAQEIWTFRRVHGGKWLLSAIQQVR